jgi:uncharacterized membrane protein YkvA (DUF1232 family)
MAKQRPGKDGPGNQGRLGRVGALYGARRAAQYLRNPARARRLLEDALRKARDNASGPLSEVFDSLLALLRMARAYASRQYTTVPVRSMVWVLGAILYFVLPFDLVPDFVAGVGLLDDLYVIRWVLSAIQDDLAEFLEWERERNLRDSIPGTVVRKQEA